MMRVRNRRGECGALAVEDTGAPARESFADVRRACHRWLMRRDPAYRREREYYAAHRPGNDVKIPGERGDG